MSSIQCPFCGKPQNKSIKKWKYGQVRVNRFHCKCGNLFNYYKSKNSTWTIPKKS